MAPPVEPPVSPMLAKSVDRLPDVPLLYEPKWDGFRCIVFRDSDEVTLTSRNEKPFNRYFPELLPALLEQLPKRCVLDGEIVVPTGHGLDFGALQMRIHPAESRVAILAEQTPSAYVAFDGLHVTSESARGVPHASGLTTANEVIEADIVIDAMGRRSPMPRWLTALGAAEPYEESVDSGFAYYGQHLQSDDGSLPERKAGGLTAFHGYSILTLPGDNGSWFYGVYASSNDAEMRRLRDRDTIHRLLRACPLHAHWLDGREISDITSMTGVTDRDRRYVIDGRPVVTEVLALADAWACTNPSLGRGMSIGLDHARHLQDTLRDASSDPTELALRWDDVTKSELAPWHC
ncbi:MAG: hypothetical protein P8N02_14515, partial [Actinomycetota bacterium]|nr:hypothetical protein [Actinomycetota bacterium]